MVSDFHAQRATEYREALWQAIWNAMRDYDYFKGAAIPNAEGSSVLLFREGIGIRVTVEVAHVPEMEGF